MTGNGCKDEERYRGERAKVKGGVRVVGGEKKKVSGALPGKKEKYQIGGKSRGGRG